MLLLQALLLYPNIFCYVVVQVVVPDVALVAPAARCCCCCHLNINFSKCDKKAVRRLNAMLFKLKLWETKENMKNQLKICDVLCRKRHIDTKKNWKSFWNGNLICRSCETNTYCLKIIISKLIRLLVVTSFKTIYLFVSNFFESW